MLAGSAGGAQRAQALGTIPQVSSTSERCPWRVVKMSVAAGFMFWLLGKVVSSESGAWCGWRSCERSGARVGPGWGVDSAFRLCFTASPYTVPYTFPKRPLHVSYAPYKCSTFADGSANRSHGSIRAKVASPAPPRFLPRTRVCHQQQAGTPGIRWPSSVDELFFFCPLRGDPGGRRSKEEFSIWSALRGRRGDPQVGRERESRGKPEIRFSVILWVRGNPPSAIAAWCTRDPSPPMHSHGPI